MKVIHVTVAMMLLVGSVGCGKTLAELRTDGGAVVDTGSSIVKKAIDAGIAVYDIVKKVVEDTKDNVVTVKDTVIGTETK